MLRTINIDTRVPTLHGVLIRRAALEECQRAFFTVREARCHAANIVKNALRKAEQIELQAMKDGFQAGWTECLSAIVAALKDSDAFHQRLEHELKSAVRTTLQQTAQQPELVLHLIEGWLSSNPPVSEQLTVILPCGAQAQIDTVRNRVLDKTGINPQVMVGEGPGVVIQFNDHGYEFSPQRTLGEIDETVHRSFQSLAVRKQCSIWSKEAVRALLSNLAQRIEPDISDDSGDPGAPDAEVESAAPEAGEAAVDNFADYEDQLDQELFDDLDDDAFDDPDTFVQHRRDE